MTEVERLARLAEQRQGLVLCALGRRSIFYVDQFTRHTLLELLKDQPASFDDCLSHMRQNWMSAGWHRRHLKFCGGNFRDD